MQEVDEARHDGVPGSCQSQSRPSHLSRQPLQALSCSAAKVAVGLQDERGPNVSRQAKNPLGDCPVWLTLRVWLAACCRRCCYCCCCKGLPLAVHSAAHCQVHVPCAAPIEGPVPTFFIFSFSFLSISLLVSRAARCLLFGTQLGSFREELADA